MKPVLALVLFAFALAALAQPPAKIPRIGLVAVAASPDELLNSPAARAFVQGLGEYGWVPGKNIEVLSRTAEGNWDRIPVLIDELLRLPVDVLLVNSDGMAKVALSKTRRIPIVMTYSSAPVERGIVKSLSRPGGNVTGIIDFIDPHIDGKRLQLLKEADPRVRRVVFLGDGPEPWTFSPETIADAHVLGISIFQDFFVTADQIAETIERVVQRGANGILVGNGAKLNNRFIRAIVQREALRHRLPAIYAAAVSDEDLMAYGTGWDNQRRSAYFVDRILKGANPADLPIERTARPRLFVNLRAAKAIGLTMPASLLVQAERVVE